MAQNKLSSVLNVFMQKEITIEELFDLNNNDLKEFGHEIGLDVLNINRLIKAINKVKPNNYKSILYDNDLDDEWEMKNNRLSFIPASLSSSLKSNIIITQQETNAINKFNKIYNKALLMSNNLDACNHVLNRNTVLCNENIKNEFDELKNILNQKRDNILNHIDELNLKKKDKLSEQIDELKDYSYEVTEGKQEYESLISDTSYSLKERKKKVVKLSDKLTKNNPKSGLINYLSTQPTMKLSMNKQDFNKCLRKYIELSKCDEPSKPSLSITKRGADFIAIKYKIKQLETYSTISVNKVFVEFSDLGAVKKKDKNDDSDSDDDNDSDSDSDSDDSKSDSDNDDSDDEDSDGDDDDNIDYSKLYWNSISIPIESHNYKLIKLLPGHKYCIRISAENKSGVSYSKIETVKTKDNVLVWLKSPVGNSVTFIKKNRCRTGNYQAKIAADITIDGSKTKLYAWEIELHTISNYSYLGWVNAPATTTITNWNYYIYSGHYGHHAVGISNNSTAIYIQSYGGWCNGCSVYSSTGVKLIHLQYMI